MYISFFPLFSMNILSISTIGMTSWEFLAILLMTFIYNVILRWYNFFFIFQKCLIFLINALLLYATLQYFKFCYCENLYISNSVSIFL